MNARIAAFLVAALLVLGGGALLLQQQGRSQRPAESGALGQPLLKGLQAAAVSSIRIGEAGATLTLERKDARWIIAERAGFPADLGKVRDFVIQAIGLKVGQSEPIGDKDRARLQLDVSGARVEFLDAQGKTLASFIAGRKFFKREPENPGQAAADGRFVLLPDDPGRVVVVASPLTQVTARTAEWVSRQGLAIEKLRTLEYRPAAGEGWKIERAGDNTEWQLAGAKPQEKLEITKVNAAAYSLQNLDIADVAAGNLKPEDTGLDQPAQITAATFEGLTYTIRVGKLAGEQYHVAFGVAGEPKTEGQDAEERNRKLAEHLPREKALADYVLLVAKGRLEDVLKARAELLAKPQEQKK
ncbi:MAG: DUF4340 domain-containing protein [Betaproteobacteria bacterium]|nr:MAG: DUF4340 domain-containing protein [Betaproteobacteria bacterium]